MHRIGYTTAALLCAAIGGAALIAWPSPHIPVASASASSSGQWSAVQTWPVPPTNAVLLPTGKLLIYPAWSGDQPKLWDPATGTSSALPNAGYNIFCNGTTFLADGRLFMAGGHTDGLVKTGLPNASLFDASTSTWTHIANMNAGRWYPTTTMLANGDVLVVSGSVDDAGNVNKLPQVWQPGSSTWRNLTSAVKDVPLYPQLYLAPNGKVFGAAPNQDSWYLDTTGTGAWSTLVESHFGYREYSSSVMYDRGKILLLGGGDPPTATAEVIDLTTPTPSWRSVASMSFARKQANATLLPDGKVLVTGGSNGPGNDNASFPVYAAELWDPATEQWTVLSSAAQYRGYHSTAVLLPDGRVVSGGGEYSGATAEVFSPPYLFNGPRPTISSVPSSVGYGQTFTVQTADSASVTRVTLLKPGAVTHAFNMNQRISPLSFSQVAGGLSVTAPADANVTPPGDYLLFILNGGGIPSLGARVRIGASGPLSINAPSQLTATAAGSSQINLRWQDNSTNESGFRVQRSVDGVSFTNHALVGASITVFSDSGLAASTKYDYRIVAVNETVTPAVISPASNVAGAATGATGSPVPAAPSNLVATAQSSTRVDLTWSDNSNNETSFWVARSMDGTTFAGRETLPANSTSFSDTSLSPSTQYYYIVLATNSGVTPAADSPPSNTATVSTPAGPSPVPAAPTNLAASAVSATRIDLTWQDNSTNETSFWLARSTDNTSFDGRETLPANTTSFSDTAVSPSTKYYYYVLATNGSVTPVIDSPASNTASATTPAGQSMVPAAPSNLTATAISPNRIRLTWQDNSNNESSFWLARSTDGVNYVGRATIPANRTTHTDTGLRAGTRYYYRILATNSSVTPVLDSPPSNTASATTPR